MDRMIRLAGIFGDGMILQRDQTNHIWGFEPRENTVSLQLDGVTYTARVENHIFRIRLAPHAVATGLRMLVSGTGCIEIREISFGDVFLLSGQSNMELPVSCVLDASGAEIKAANDPLIRQYRLMPQYVFGDNQTAELPAARWTAAVPGEIEEMSAAGYFFATEIRKEKNVPVGLILNAQGGASIEAWMPEDTLLDFGDFTPEIAPFRENGSLDTFLAQREERIAAWYRGVEGVNREEMSRAMPADALRISLPKVFEGPDGEKFSGSMWFYKEIFLRQEPLGEALLYAGELIDSDQAYINGVKVGETAYRYPTRKYRFDASILRKGKNLIAIRLVVENDFGGFVPEHPYYLTIGEESVSLAGEWFYATEKKAATHGVEGFLAQKIPTGLFRAALLPLAGLHFRGALWYQGESNAGEPRRYDEKFAVMTKSWREALGFCLPIIAVELADYEDPQNGSDEGWAGIQRQQLQAPERVSRCGVVSAKDLGAPFELHPQRKKELGERLAAECLRLMYNS